MDLYVEEDWREEDDDWHAGDLRKLRKQLGPPGAQEADPPPPAESEPAETREDTPAVNPDDPRYDTDVWAADLTRVLDRTTGGDVPLGPELIRRVADHLLHHTSGLLGPEPDRARRPEGAPYVPDFTVDRWADCIHESLKAVTDGRIEVSRAELHVAANLLLHAEEEGWVAQASLLRRQYEVEAGESP
jgi:hypothetical protein